MDRLAEIIVKEIKKSDERFAQKQKILGITPVFA